MGPQLVQKKKKNLRSLTLCWEFMPLQGSKILFTMVTLNWLTNAPSNIEVAHLSSIG